MSQKEDQGDLALYLSQIAWVGIASAEGSEECWLSLNTGLTACEGSALKACVEYNTERGRQQVCLGLLLAVTDRW